MVYIGVEWTVLGLYHLLGVGSSARGEWWVMGVVVA